MPGPLGRRRTGLGEFWSPPDAAVLEAGSAAEPLIARVRLGLTGVLLFVPFTNLILTLRQQLAFSLKGLAFILFALLLALVAYALVERSRHQPWLGLATTLVDVTLVTTVLVGFSLLGDPHQAINSKVTFEVYFLAIGATCLRYDPRLAVAAGLAAMFEYAGVVFWVTQFHDLGSSRYAPWVFGHFDWNDQVSRVIILGLQAALCTVIVVRLNRHRRLSNTDRLTGLYNRSHFDRFLAAEAQRSKRYSRSFAVAIVSIDRFKVFNEDYGNVAGDQALRGVADLLRRSFRGSDLVARHGGAAMGVVMPETTLDQARLRLESIRKAVAAEALTVPRQRSPVQVTVSAGVGCWPEDGEQHEELLRVVEARLFHAEALGRNRVVSSSIAAASV